MGVVHLPSLTPSPRTEKASRVPPRRGRAAIARLAAAAAAPQKTTLAEEWHSVLQHPPLRLGEIQQRAFQRNGVAAALSELEAAGGGLLEVRACNRSHPACSLQPAACNPISPACSPIPLRLQS